MILFLYTMTAKDKQLNDDDDDPPPMWYTINSGDSLTPIPAPSKHELDIVLSVLSRKISDKKSWEKIRIAGNIEHVSRLG